MIIVLLVKFFYVARQNGQNYGKFSDFLDETT